MTITPIPATPYLALEGDGAPCLLGSRCAACGQVHLGSPGVCPACTARGKMQPQRLAARGRVYSFTTVHRSFPGVKVPFVMAVVDLDNGPAVRGTLTGIDPAAVDFDMPVQVVFGDTGQTDASGNPFVAFSFVPDLEARP